MVRKLLFPISSSKQNSESPDAVAKIFSADNASTEFLLKKTKNNYLRYTALLFLCDQNADLVGLYVIGVNYLTEKIYTITGARTTITRDGDNVTISFTDRSNIWSSGIIIAPKEYL